MRSKVDQINDPSENKGRWVLLFFVGWIGANLFTVYFVRQERFIYSWDLSGYWLNYQFLGNLFRTKPLSALCTVLHSIRNDDYNSLPVLFLIPFQFLFGNNRLAFILSIVNIFALPSILLFSLFYRRLTSGPYKNNSFNTSLIPLSTLALLPQFWVPILWGEPGVAGIVVIMLILLLYFKKPLEQQRLTDLLLIGFLLALVIMVRRWYAYWVVAFFAASAFETFALLFPPYRFRMRSYLPAARNLFIIGISSLAVFFAVATTAAKRMLLTDYADIYSAWKYGNSIMQITIHVLLYLGPLFILLALLGLAQSMLTKSERSFALFFLVQCIVAFLLFARTQLFGPQHYYILIPPMAIFLSLFATAVYKRLNKAAAKIFFLTLYISVLLISFSVVFIPKTSDFVKNIRVLLPSVRNYPLVRNDMSEINRILDVLEKELFNGADDHVYVLSSSAFLFNDEILRNACFERKPGDSRCYKILKSNHVDKRDGFPFQLLGARYVVVTDPIQYHLGPGDQRIIGIPTEQITKQRGIGTSYEKLPYDFTLDGKVKVYIYEKVQPLKRADLDRLSVLFMSYYPDKKDMFFINPFCGLILNKEGGDVVGEVSCRKDSVFMQPGASKPSKMTLALNKKYTSMKMRFAFRDPQKIPLYCRDIDGEIGLQINADGKKIYQEDISYKKEIPYQLDLKEIDNLEIVVDKGKNGPDCDWFLIKDILIH